MSKHAQATEICTLDRSAAATSAERRNADRVAVESTVWLADRAGKVITNAKIQNAAPGGVRLQVPLGFGVREGQCYELRAYAPGTPPDAFGLHASRWGRVIRTKIMCGDGHGQLAVAMRFDAPEARGAG